MQVRPAELTDATEIANIYNAEVLGSIATFDLVPRSLEDQLHWLQERSGAFACVVAEDDRQVIGWASLSPYRPKPAYSTSVENSIYVDRDHHGEGVGNALLEQLMTIADDHGFHSVFARIIDGQPASVELHRKHGFVEIGIEREVGRKFGRWHDVLLMQRLATTTPPSAFQ